jgi:hypothetical protein
LAVLLFGAPATADTVSGTRSGSLVEKDHQIELLMHRGHAELRVRRTVYNGGERHDQATFLIDVPNGAVATGLRTLGTLNGRPHWFTGELMEAEAAAAKYRELTGMGGYYPKDPALLSWRSQRLLALQVFPCPPIADKSIEYTLFVPTVYRDGAHRLELPAMGTDELVAGLHVRAGASPDRVSVDGRDAVQVVRLKHDELLSIALIPAKPTLVEGELASVALGGSRALTRYTAWGAPALSAVPRGAYIVAIIDASLSTDSGFIERAKQALGAYLSHFEDAHVDVMLFHRKTERPFRGFIGVADARTRLEALAVHRKNGSAIDVALAEADTDLAKAPEGAEKRIVLVTDGLTRSGITAERLRAATTRSGAAIHLGLLESGAASLTRLDDHPWRQGIEPNRGIVWRANIPDARTPEVRAVLEEWARPTRLHHVRVYSNELSLQPALEALPWELKEGQGIELLTLHEQRTEWVGFEGVLWTERVTTAFRTNAAAEKRWSALAFGSRVLHELSEEEMMPLAMAGGAVSPVTSYLAIEPGVRPSTEGLDWGAGEGSARGGVMVRMGATGTSFNAPPLDRDGFLRDMLSKDWRRCGGRPGEATVSFETTRAEVAHVDRPSLYDPDPLLAQCLVEAVWDLVLPAAFADEWQTYSVHL